MYKKDALKKYIEDSELKIVNDNLHIRLSKELAKKYDDGVYTNSIDNFKYYVEQINSINLIYPGNAHPIFYIYLVPDDNFVDLLKFPFPNKKGGGRPVSSYDIDGFNLAYGISQNSSANASKGLPYVARVVNNIHELAHLVSNQFFIKNKFLSEGFAETLPLYTLDYESKFDEHRNALKNMNENQIYSAKELMNMENNNSFRENVLLPNKSCSFRLAYISSYLFVRGCIELIAVKHKLTRAKATQKFLEIVRSSMAKNECLICDLAAELDIFQDELLYGKTIQINTLKNL